MFEKELKYKWYPQIHDLVINKDNDTVMCADLPKDGSKYIMENEFSIAVGQSEEVVDYLHCEYNGEKKYFEPCELCTAELVYSLLKKGEEK
jgi:hypothetical protein